MAKSRDVHWFQLGAQTLRAVLRAAGAEGQLPTSEDWYICPLCLHMKVTVEELDTHRLTAEHVPPRALGGKELVLTCQNCNNTHGSKFDSAAHRQREVRSFMAGTSDRRVLAKFNVDGFETNVWLRRVGSDFHLSGDPKISNPKDKEALDDHLATASSATLMESKVRISTRLKYDPARARISWIRTGYLAAFAFLGWRYILRETLDPIRACLARSDAEPLPFISGFHEERDPRDRYIAIARQDENNQCLVVIVGQHLIFLPGPMDRRTLKELEASIGAGPGKEFDYSSLVADVYSWPLGPLHRMDPPPVTGQGVVPG